MTSSGLKSILEAALYVDDLDQAEWFYGEVLGLERITRLDGRHVFFRCGDGVLLTFIAQTSRKPPPADALPVPPHGADGPGHVCFAVEPDRIDPLITSLATHGIAVESDFRWPHGPRSVYVRDPFDNSIEFAEPNLWDLQE